MRRLIPLILALLLMSGDGRFKCWYSSWYEHPEIDWLNLTGGSFTEAEAEAAAEGEALTLEYAESWDSPSPERYRCIYGSDFGLLGYWDAHDASRGGPDVSVSDGWTITRFIFNEDDRVYKIEIWASVD